MAVIVSPSSGFSYNSKEAVARDFLLGIISRQDAEDTVAQLPTGLRIPEGGFFPTLGTGFASSYLDNVDAGQFDDQFDVQRESSGTVISVGGLPEGVIPEPRWRRVVDPDPVPVPALPPGSAPFVPSPVLPVPVPPPTDPIFGDISPEASRSQAFASFLASSPLGPLTRGAAARQELPLTTQFLLQEPRIGPGGTPTGNTFADFLQGDLGFGRLEGGDLLRALQGLSQAINIPSTAIGGATPLQATQQATFSTGLPGEAAGTALNRQFQAGLLPLQGGPRVTQGIFGNILANLFNQFRGASPEGNFLESLLQQNPFGLFQGLGTAIPPSSTAGLIPSTGPGF
jgi:hypothetical protein